MVKERAGPELLLTTIICFEHLLLFVVFVFEAFWVEGSVELFVIRTEKICRECKLLLSSTAEA